MHQTFNKLCLRTGTVEFPTQLDLARAERLSRLPRLVKQQRDIILAHLSERLATRGIMVAQFRGLLKPLRQHYRI